MTTTSARAPRSSRPTPRAARPGYACTECGWTATKWAGRCGECQAWGTVVEDAPLGGGPRTVATSALRTPAMPIGDIDVDTARARPTGVGELDRVLGGGLVPGAVVLVAGEPGVGKSTMLLDVAATLARAPGERVLYVTGEESAGQVRLRAERIGALAPGLLLVAETDLGTVLGHIDAVRPSLLVVDSVQTIASAFVEGAPGGVSQVREVAAALIAVAKERDMPTLLVGHVTKDGTVAGPRTLEHLVDVVCQFEGDRHSRLRLVRATKNRYGPTDEVGCFDLTEHGILELPDPSGLFLSHTVRHVAGTCVTVTLEGRRALATEVQALVVPSVLSNPRRVTSGVDSSRLAMVLAVLQRRAGVSMADKDVYVSTVGGSRVVEPAADLGIALATASGSTDVPLADKLVAIGEVGLAGEIRRVTGLPRRLAEARRLGFTSAVVAEGSVEASEVPDGMTLLEATDLAHAVALSRGPRLRER
ncbi:MAG TPA: DNA repair protein RadA [Actinotalea sp.]